MYEVNCQGDGSICHKQYVGEMSQTVNARFRVHESFIRTKKDNIAQHFNMEDHTPTSYTIKIVGQEEDKNRRLHPKESQIHLLDTIKPKGLNLKLQQQSLLIHIGNFITIASRQNSI